MNGVVFGDAIGIAFNGGGTLVVENSIIAGFIAGFASGIYQIAAGSNLIVNNCEFRNNGAGVRNNTGSDTNSNAVIENSRFEYNSDGVSVGPGTANVSIRNSVFGNNSNGLVAQGSSQTQPVLVVVDTCTIAHNGNGLNASAGAFGSAIFRVTNSTIDHNASGMLMSGAGAAIESYGNNRVTANTSGSTFSGTVLPLQ